MLAGLIAALYWPFIYFEGELLIPSLLVPLVLTAFLLLEGAVRCGAGRLFALSGVLFGLAAITRPNIILFFPVLVFWLLKFHMPPDKGVTALKASGLVVLGITACIVPVTFRNYVVSGDTVLISSQAGVNFYIGNNEYSDGKTAILPGTRATWWGGYLDSIRIAEEDSGRSLYPSEVSRYWLRQGLSFVCNQPGKAASLYLKKLRYLLNNVEISNNQNIYFFRDYVGFISLPFFIGFPLLAPLGFAGLAVLRKDRRWWMMAGFILAYSLSILLFFVTGRYRLPIVAFLIIPAAGLLAEAGALAGRRDFRRLALRGCLVLALLAVFKLNSLSFPPRGAAAVSDGHYTLANALARKGKQGEAYGYYRQTTSLEEPYRSRSYLNLGRIDLARGKAAEAEASLARAHSLNPALDGEISRLLMENDGEEMRERVFGVSGETAAMRAGYYMSRGDALLRKRIYDKAAKCYERVTELDKSFAGAFVNLGNIYSMDDARSDEAAAVYSKGLEHHPGDLALNYNLAGLCVSRGENDKAVSIIRSRLLAAEPRNPLYLELLRRATARRSESSPEAGARLLTPGYH